MTAYFINFLHMFGYLALPAEVFLVLCYPFASNKKLSRKQLAAFPIIIFIWALFESIAEGVQAHVGTPSGHYSVSAQPLYFGLFFVSAILAAVPYLIDLFRPSAPSED